MIFRHGIYGLHGRDEPPNDREPISRIQKGDIVITLFPAFLKLQDRRVVVIGGGPVAASKLAALQSAGAHVVVVAPQVCDAIRATGVNIVERPYVPADLDAAWFVVAAAPPHVNRAVSEEAERRQLFVNAVDDPGNASVYLGGVVRRPGLTLAISTEGAAPALAGLLREALDYMLPGDLTLSAWDARAREIRQSWRARGVPMEARRPELLEALNALYESRAASGSRVPTTATAPELVK
ncbi:MAG: bifunctional precorrin-2 dehydrogenase/sirohydrochlorin ferrochelatase [Vicinamibacterales bacterium]